MSDDKKIGIITLSASDNCGSLLQSYALKKIVEPYGNVEIINFLSEKSHKYYDVFSKNNKINLSKYINPFKRLKKIFLLLKSKKHYQFFRKKYLNLKGIEINKNNISRISNKYDIVLSGSDQVWNVMMGDFDSCFFANWTNCKKVAYAPSLGGHDIRESKDAQKYIDYLRKFDYLSVREGKGKNCLEEILQRRVELVLDPTLLIEVSEWRRLVGKPFVKGDYYFFYSWAYNYEPFLDLVMGESEKNGVPAYVIDARKWIRQNKWNFKMIKQEGPIAFLNLMYYAKRCYVESFHGLIFAYIFKKNFWLLDEHDSLNDMDTRLKELIMLLKAGNRVISTKTTNLIDHNENFNFVGNAVMDNFKNISLNYLEGALK